MADIIIDELIRSKRKTISIIVNKEGRVVVRAPKRASNKYINSIIVSKKTWIEKKRKDALEKLKLKPEKKYEEGEEFLFLGESYKLKLSDTTEYYLEFDDEKFILDSSSRQMGREYFKEWYRRQALSIISDLVEDISKVHGFQYNKVKISNARKIWGSCSGKGNLNFSWRLVLAPPAMLRYVVCHEMAHLRELNHSPKFWGIVEKLHPDYKVCRKWFNDNGHLLDI